MYKFFCYFEKRDISEVETTCGLRFGYVKHYGDDEIIFVNSRYKGKSFDTEEEVRELISKLRMDKSLAEYRFRVVRDNSYCLAQV